MKNIKNELRVSTSIAKFTTYSLHLTNRTIYRIKSIYKIIDKSSYIRKDTATHILFNLNKV